MPARAAFVGPLPPPVHGFSNICAAMLGILRLRLAVDVFDRAPSANRILSGVRQVIQRPAKYLLLSIARRYTVLYLALSGGRGQLVDLVYLLIARVFNQRIYVHHHSFAYINAPSFLNRLCFSVMRDQTHIVLSAQMGVRLAQAYGLPEDRIKVISNAAFYASPADSLVDRDDAAPLRIGFLSNITYEKGFVEFFEVLQNLEASGVPCEGCVAGPAANDVQQRLDELLARTGNVRYLGALYGEAKDSFYRDLDVFLFPTRYVNEAEPLVIYEALRLGVHVIACDRGAIAEMLGNGAGAVFPADAFATTAAERITRLSSNRQSLRKAKQMSLLQAQRIRMAGKATLEEIMTHMQNGSANRLDASRA